jgi:hypothetical protein
LGLAILIALVSWGSLEGYGSLQAAHLIDSLKTTNIRDVPARIEQLRTYSRWAGRPLAGLLASTENDRDQHLQASFSPARARRISASANSARSRARSSLACFNRDRIEGFFVLRLLTIGSPRPSWPRNRTRLGAEAAL